MTDPKLTETQMADLDAMRADFKQRGGGAGRWIENALALAGIAQACLYGTLEALRSVGYSLGECKPDTGIPWVTLSILFACVLPKTVGRATAGKAWESIAGLIGRKP